MDWKTCFKGKKVLVAEDDPVSQEMMRDILENMGMLVTIAKDGYEVVEKFQQGSYDIIIMDVRMPRKDGIQATREIRALEKGNKPTPIIALTASILESDKQQIIQYGATDFVSKPLQFEELRTKLAQGLKIT